MATLGADTAARGNYHSASNMYLVAKLSMLIMSMSDVSMPIDARDASKICCEIASSNVISVKPCNTSARDAWPQQNKMTDQAMHIPEACPH